MRLPRALWRQAQRRTAAAAAPLGSQAQRAGSNLAEKSNFAAYLAAFQERSPAAPWAYALARLRSLRDAPATKPQRDEFAAAAHLCKEGRRWREAVAVLDELGWHQLQPSRRMLDAVLGACVGARQWPSALHLLSLSLKGGVAPSVIAFNKTISCLAAGPPAQALDMSLVLLSQLTASNGMPTVVTYNTLIRTCDRASDWQAALQLLDRMVTSTSSPAPDIVSFNTALSACESSQRWDVAIALMEALPAQKLEADVVTISTAVSACAGAAQWRLAIAFYNDAARDTTTPNTFMLNATISAMEKGDQWPLALHVLRQAGSAAGQPSGLDVISYNATISAAEKGHQWTVALSLLREMGDSKITPDIISYSAAISALGKGGQWQLALQTFEDLRGAKLRASLIAFSSAMSGTEVSAAWRAALQLFDDMLSSAVHANTIAYNIVISAMGKAHLWEESCSLLRRMSRESVAADSISYNAAIATLAGAAEWPRAIAMLDNATDDGVEPDMDTFSRALMLCEQEACTPVELGVHEALRVAKLQRSGELLTDVAVVSSRLRRLQDSGTL
eukprot:TRINITY_DN42628_c0_g1_i1.p1 TRINITY_DN42628_c0_g1~~TRINITY_DN42628_c0_g1_i1.p1  ORF type:complete len:561 (+),score=116.37 TRINITY_DN42628_c0_g1_i1:293-1975(+)